MPHHDVRGDDPVTVTKMDPTTGIVGTSIERRDALIPSKPPAGYLGPWPPPDTAYPWGPGNPITRTR